MSLGKFCKACQAIPAAGYCNLAGCPNKPPRRLFGREFCASGRDILALSDGGGMVIAKAADTEIAAEIAELLNAVVPTRYGDYPARPDLALGALQVAVKSDQLDVATCFAQTAIDFLTGNYDPENFDLSDEENRT